MLLIRTLALCLLVLLMGADGAKAGGHVFLFSTVTDVITVLDSDDLSPVTTLAGTMAAREVIASPDGKKYYIISSRSTETILVVDVETLTITKRISLGANPRVVEMTPDGRYLLIGAGSLRVLDVETDREIGAGIAVGQGPTDIVVDSSSAKAYVLADGGKVISIIDLGTLTVEQTLNVAAVTSIALTPDDFRLLAVSRQRLHNFRTADLEEISSIDANGFATVICRAIEIKPGAGSAITGFLTASLPDFTGLGSTKFTFSVSSSANLISMVSVAGDGQTAQTGEMLPEPLVFRMESAFAATGEVGIRIRQLFGPPVNLTPTFLTTHPFFNRSIQVTLGPNAGNVGIQAEALAPEFPSVMFNITATGGLPESFQIEGNGQSGRVGKELPMPLRMRVINESGAVVPFPEVSWAVVEGNATLITATDPDGATARVMMGDVPGPIQVSASIAGLTAVFDLTATPPEPVSISTVSGQNQILAAGDLSEPLIAQVNEIDNVPASNVVVEFSGPNFVVLHPLDGSPPGNPVSQVTGPDGQAAVRVELPIVAGVSLGPDSNDQFSRTISIVANVDDTLSTTFVLGSIGRTPSFVSGGIVNAATFQAGIVPGSLASLFGEGLSEGISETVLAGGSTSFQGTTVLIGGIPSPLLSITGSPVEQINLQVPFELATGTTTTIEVENNGTRTTVSGVPVFSTQPGIFEIPDPAGGTVGAVIDAQTFEPITTENPAARDRPLSVFFTGGGALLPTVLTGVFGRLPPAIMTETVVVGVDDKGSKILFQGYAPGFLGLYQVNFDLPEDAGCGVRNLVIRVGGSFSLDSKTVIQCP